MVIFNSYVKLPEGNHDTIWVPYFFQTKPRRGFGCAFLDDLTFMKRGMVIPLRDVQWP